MDILKNFSFELNTKIEFGPGISSKTGDLLKNLGALRILIVTDPGIEKSGLLGGITARLKEKEIVFSVFDAIEPNPRIKNVDDCALAARELKADWLLAVGGGSPIDCAKAAAVLTTHEGSIRDYEGVENIPGTPLPIVAIPTTSGTGSELTMSSVITDSAENYKFSLRSKKIAPVLAIADPNMTATMPPALTASTGMDALTHAIEGYTAKLANPISDAAALYAIELIVSHLKIAFSEPENMEARAGMLLGSMLAGVAFSRSDVGSVHCLAETLGGMYDLPHGLCNSVILPHIMAHNLEYCRERYSRIAGAMGIESKSTEESPQNAIEAVKNLSEKVELPTFNSLGVKEEDFNEIAEKSVRNGSNTSNPRPMDKKDYISVLQRMQQ